MFRFLGLVCIRVSFVLFLYWYTFIFNYVKIVVKGDCHGELTLRKCEGRNRRWLSFVFKVANFIVGGFFIDRVEWLHLFGGALIAVGC